VTIRTPKRLAATVLAVAVAAVPAAGASASAPPIGAPATVTLVTHDSFPTADTTINDALDRFGAATGIDVEILAAGDAGTMVTKAVLTAGNPEGDVLYGVDNTYLTRAVDGGVFEPYTADGLDAIPTELRAAIPADDSGDPAVTPIDYGDVCVNHDIAWFAERDLEPPAGLADLAEPEYADLLVVQNPASSSPGLAFLLATIAEFGDAGDGGGWEDYWSELAANGVEVVDDWTGAYYERFSGTGGGDKPLVVSYGSSPPFEVIYADPPVDEPSTGAIASTCFRQIEYAGVLAGTDEPVAARRLVDFLISEEFQAEIALNLFVFPVVDVPLPPEIERFSVIPDEPLALDPGDIAAHREDWIETWTDLVLR